MCLHSTQLPRDKHPTVKRQHWPVVRKKESNLKLNKLCEMAARMDQVLIELQSHPIIAAQRASQQQVEQETGLVLESEQSPRAPSFHPSPPHPEPRRPESPVSSLPTVSEFAAPSVALQHHPLTGQLEPPLRRVKKLRIEELVALARRMRGLSEITRNQLAEADRCIHRGRNAEAIPCLEAALLGATDEPELQCLLWRLLGNAHLSLGHFKKASVCHMHQIAFCRELDDFGGMTMAECNLGITYLKQGLFKLAGRCFTQYLDNSRILRDDMGVSYACSNLGVLEKTMALQKYRSLERGYHSEEDKEQTMEDFKAHLRKAISYFEQHLEIVERAADLEKQARAYYNLGSCYEIQNHYAQAIFCHNKRLSLVRSTSNRVAEVCTLCNLGNCLRATGKLEDAIENYSLALELCQASSNKASELVALLNLGTTCELMGRADKAIEWHTLALSLCVQTNNLQGQARAFGTLADLYSQTGQIMKSHEYYKKLVHVFEQIGDRDCQSIASHYVLQTKEALERRKRILKRQKGKKKSKGGSRGRREQRQEFRQGRLGNLHVSNSMMIRSKGNTPQSRKDKGQAQNTTWSPGLKRWYGVKASKAWSSTVVLENRHAREATGLNTRRNLYRTSGMAEQLNEHEGDLENFLKAVRPSFYTLEEYMVGGGMSDNECNDSITEYEDVEDDPFQPRQQPLLFGSTRHMKDLRQVSHSLLSKSASDPGADGAREEWAEWLRSHGMCQDDDNEDSPPPPLPPRADPLAEEPQSWHEDPSSARPETQTGARSETQSGSRSETQTLARSETQTVARSKTQTLARSKSQTGARPETQSSSPKQRKRSFQGLSIFNTQSQDQQPETGHPTTSRTNGTDFSESRLI